MNVGIGNKVAHFHFRFEFSVQCGFLKIFSRALFQLKKCFNDFSYFRALLSSI
jgi:hypothetical protein